MRTVSVARRGAVKARTSAINQLRAVQVSAPQDIRERLLKIKTAERVGNRAQLRSLGNTPMLETPATMLCLLAKRYLALTEERGTLDAMLERLTLKLAMRLQDGFGVGPQTATPEIRNPESWIDD
jgi:transposase